MNLKIKRMEMALLLLLSSAWMWAQSVYPGVAIDKMPVNVGVPVKAESFDLKDVRLLPSRFRENMERDSAWMVSLSTDRLLHSFRTNAGVRSGREGGYMAVRKLAGWESLDCELRGHTTGHLLSAYALMYAGTGSIVFQQKGDSLVSGLAEVQRVLGNGYLSAFPEELINRNIRGEGVWAPWYTLHKLLSGLIDQYLYADNKEALNIVKGMADWAYRKLQPLDEETRQRMIRNEFGGVNESFYNLYALTGDEHCLWLARFFYHNEVIDPLKEQNADFGTKHTNTFIPKVIAEARNYELTGEEKSCALTHFFWEEMCAHHIFATGECSDKEHFFDPKQTSRHLTGYTGETCCTYNMLKLSRHLFCWTGDVRVVDYYERALYNHILGQQDTLSGMFSYFLPLQPGAHKVYSTPDSSFWCCVGSGFESNAKYGEAIYYHSEEELYVNLFIPSQVTWKEKELTVVQETLFPTQSSSTLTVHAAVPVRSTFCIRYPSWSGKAIVKVNGRKVTVRQSAGSYISLTRTWKEGDRVDVTFPMRLRVETTPDDASVGTVMYGPIVLAGVCGTEGMQVPAPFSNPKLYNDYYSYDYRIPTTLNASLAIDVRHPEQSLRREGSGLTFVTTDGQRLEPLFNIHRQRYVVYWNLVGK